MQSSAENSYPELGARTIGNVNWLGVWTLYSRESRRFIKVWSQTLAAPAITTILFMVIFTLAFAGGRTRVTADVPFSQFLAPGLIIMAILQNSFANTSSSILVAKVQGNIVDTLMPPLSALELTVGYSLGGITRGILVGLCVAVAFLLVPSITMKVPHIWAVIYFAIAASAMLSFMGVLTAIWAEKFDHASLVQNFVVAPLSLLSGTFYSIDRLGEHWQIFSKLNPFFYMIDGFRYGFIGHADSDLMVGVLYTLILNALLLFAVFKVFKTGYRLKA